MPNAGPKSLLRLVRSGVVGVVHVVVALVLLFEEWGWQPLLAAFRWLERFRIVARIEQAIAALPPYAALAVFVSPSAILLPVKLAGLWLLAHGQVLAAGLLLAAAKIASTALVARIFTLTRPALMRLSWFARLYGSFVPWKEALFARVRASFAWRYGRIVKAKAARFARRWLAVVKPRVEAAVRAVRARVGVLYRRFLVGRGRAER